MLKALETLTVGDKPGKTGTNSGALDLHTRICVELLKDYCFIEPVTMIFESGEELTVDKGWYYPVLFGYVLQPANWTFIGRRPCAIHSSIQAPV